MCIAAGYDHTCVILSDKSVKCWGKDWAGQTGGDPSGCCNQVTVSGTAGYPLPGQTATHIAAGHGHTCAILSDKSVECWGFNVYRQTCGTSGLNSQGKTFKAEQQAIPYRYIFITQICSGV